MDNQTIERLDKIPVSHIRWVPFEDVEANDYNPNTVASQELNLLAISILADGYTQPIVTVWDPDKKKYVIIDGFHRYFVMKTRKDIRDLTNGYLPIVVLDKSINERMASTVRHNIKDRKFQAWPFLERKEELQGK
jgi:ParB-like chromosome segregation protein Spo0J